MLNYNYLKDCFIKWEAIPIYSLFKHVIIFSSSSMLDLTFQNMNIGISP